MERCTFSEMLTGSLKTHIFYAVKEARTDEITAQVIEPDLAPILIGLDTKQAAAALRISGQLNAELQGLKLSFAVSNGECTVLGLMSGTQTRQDMLNVFTPLRADMTSGNFNAAYDRFFWGSNQTQPGVFTNPLARYSGLKNSIIKNVFCPAISKARLEFQRIWY